MRPRREEFRHRRMPRADREMFNYHRKLRFTDPSPDSSPQKPVAANQTFGQSAPRPNDGAVESRVRKPAAAPPKVPQGKPAWQARSMNADFNTGLTDAIMARKGRREGREVKFLCPCHDDHDPSARWNPEKHVWNCFACDAGGGAYDLAKKLNVALPEEPPSGLSFAELREYVGLPAEFLRSLGVTAGKRGIDQLKCVDIPYLGTKGELVGVQKRIRLTGDDRFRWRKGDHAVPYGIQRLPEARKQNRLLVLEGPSDCWAAWYAGFPAVGVPGASTWRSEWAPYLSNIANIFVWNEPDSGGDTLIPKFVADFPNARIIKPPSGLKDACALWHSCEHNLDAFRAKLGNLLGTARPASEIQTEALSKEASALFRQCRHLLKDSDLFKHIDRAIEEIGYAGDTGPVKAVYLALTSRLLDRPLNLAIVAPSSAGKNAAVDAALPLFQPEAHHMVKAGSARSLIYADESFEHRSVIFAEADSIPQDENNPAASAMRSLAEDQFMTYDVVEKDSQTGEFHTRRIKKKGPTGLITTSTKPLGHQMDTRVLTVSICDTQDQSRKILSAQATAVNAPNRTPNHEEFVALQKWLTLAGRHKVAIPFANKLAEDIPVTQIRIRRDFPQLLRSIQAVALLFQEQRKIDSEGRIVATVEDYRVAKDVFESVFDMAATGGVNDAVRETVGAVEKLHKETGNPATVARLAEELNLSQMGAWYRVKRALTLGHLVNEESRPYQRAKLILGDPLPEKTSALPSPESLKSVCGDKDLSENHFNALTQPQPVVTTSVSVKEYPTDKALKPVSGRHLPPHNSGTSGPNEQPRTAEDGRLPEPDAMEF